MNTPFELKTSTNTYQLYYDNRAFRMFEGQTGKSFVQLQDGRISEITALVWAGLLRYQPTTTMETADSIIDDLGYETTVEIMMKAVEQSPPFQKKSGSK